MNDADRAPFAETLSAVYALFRAELSEAALEIWWRALAPHSIEAVKEAFGRHATNPDEGRFLPRPADVVREISGTAADASTLAWARVSDAVARVGTYRSVAFDDPIVHRVIADLGGWPWLGRQTEREWPHVERRFRDAYRAWRARGLEGTDLIDHLPGIIEVANVAGGWTSHVPSPVRISASRPGLPGETSRLAAPKA